MRINDWLVNQTGEQNASPYFALLKNARLFIVTFRSGRRISYCALGPEGRQLPAGCASTRMTAPHQFSGSVSRLRRETEPENW
ncbi:hypothetical protein LF1_13790 [Rubripirellula obstinata]|uniref:Uncharacterized protein n=1 Tax=Rubripirellula obstinata TaxID=406547 RepID=A0A5B1CG04_9BACT|nr:hypothetical protein LF1_13790 [Rubripirellula obstinata]